MTSKKTLIKRIVVKPAIFTFFATIALIAFIFGIDMADPDMGLLSIVILIILATTIISWVSINKAIRTINSSEIIEISEPIVMMNAEIIGYAGKRNKPQYQFYIDTETVRKISIEHVSNKKELLYRGEKLYGKVAHIRYVETHLGRLALDVITQ